MGKSKVRTLLMASVMIMLCAAMIVGGTYALWSSSSTINNHLEAGSLSIKLERVSLTKTYLDNATGYLKTETSDPNAEPVDFSGSTTENVFGLGSDELIAPNSSYSARLKLTNIGSVAFKYDIIIELTSESNALAQQLKVYVDDDENGRPLSEFATEGGSAIISTQTMAKNDTAKEFTVKIEFVNDNEVNNGARSQEVYFDLLVKATQQTTQATTQE